jgi:hypothetical protein
LTYASTEQAVASARRRVVREYKRRGYRVVDRPDPGELPEFLKGYRPSLIAERDDDHAVVEVRTARSLKGSNEFVELASLVNGEAGWRLELVTVRPVDPLPDPEPARRHFREMANDPRLAPPDVKAVYFASVIEGLVTDLARRRGIRRTGGSIEALVHEIAFKGIVDEDTEADILSAVDLRTLVLREPGRAKDLTDAAIGRLTALCEALFEMQNEGLAA